MGIWASPSRLTYAAENSRKHHQTIDIHAQLIKPGNRQNLQLPPTPTIKTASSSTLTMDNVIEHVISQPRQINQKQQRKPTFNLKTEFLKAGIPLPRAAKVGKPGLSEFFVNPSRISKDPRTTRCKMRLTLKKWSGRNQIRPKPLLRMNQRILPKPIPPPPDSLIPTMTRNLMDEITEAVINIRKPLDERHQPQHPEPYQGHQ